MNEKLSAQLVREMADRPMNTELRDYSAKTENAFKQILYKQPVRDIAVPDVFDGRVAWKDLLQKSINQGSCGSCWAIASAQVLSDRFNINSMGLLDVNLSASKLVLCDYRGGELQLQHPDDDQQNLAVHLAIENASMGACTGNTLTDAHRYLYLVGTNTTHCFPYDLIDHSRYKQITQKISGNISQKIAEIGEPKEISEDAGLSASSLPFCQAIAGPFGDMCSNYWTDVSGYVFGTPARFWRNKGYYALPGVPKDKGSELNIRHEIYAWGPVCTGMKIYEDFYNFDPTGNSIYEWNNRGSVLTGHAVALVGWGEYDGTLYWIIRNSWGVEWGNAGFFYMRRGNDNCGIESNCVGSIPDFFYPSLHHHDHGTGILQFFKMDKKLVQDRFDLDSSLIATGGGINPETGYIRRIMSAYPSIDPKPPIKPYELPQWQHYIAGRDSTEENRLRFRLSVKSVTETRLPPIENMIYYIILFIIITVIIVVLIISEIILLISSGSAI